MEDALHNAMGQWHKFTSNVSLVLFGFVKLGCLHGDWLPCVFVCIPIALYRRGASGVPWALRKNTNGHATITHTMTNVMCE